MMTPTPRERVVTGVMDPITAASLAGTIATFLDFGSKVASRLLEFQKSTGEIPKSLKSVDLRLQLLVQSLERTKGHQSKNQAEEMVLKPVVEDCLVQVQALEAILDKTLPSKGDSTWRKGLKAVSSLNKDSDLQRINSKLAEYERSLTYFHTSFIPGMRELHIEPANPAQDPDSRKPAFLVNFDHDPDFIGRDDIIHDIFHHLESDKHRVAIYGMAGVGKSRVAIECCFKYRAKNPRGHVFWIHAGSAARFEQSYRDIAKALNLVSPEGSNGNVLSLVRDWFNETITPWFAIFDNADDMETLFAPGGGNSGKPRLPDYLPRATVGSVIVTTRDKRVAALLKATTIHLRAFKVPVAQAFLHSKLGPDTEEDTEMELVQALDCLPLAISQAAAFITQNAILPADYLELLHSSDAESKDLLAKDIYDLSRDPEIKNSIIQTWMLSFNRIREQNPNAANILSLMAVLDRQAIPSYLLRKKDDSKSQFMIAIGTLKAFSLISEESQSSTYSLHRVVHLATQAWLETQGRLLKVQHEALEIVSGRINVDLMNYNWSPKHDLLPHARLVATYERAEGTSACHAKLLSALASYDFTNGDLEFAQAAAEEAVGIYRRVGSTESMAFLGSGSLLVSLLFWEKNLQEAEALSSELLSICTKIGTTSTTIACQHASSISSQKRFDEAEQLLRQLLDRATSSNDYDVQDRSEIYQTLARTLMKSNTLSEAEQILGQGLDLVKHLPDEMIGFQRNRMQQIIGDICLRQARWHEAVDIYRKCSEFYEGYYDPSSRYTFFCQRDLIYSLLKLGHYDEVYTTAYSCLGMATRSLGTSDAFSERFCEYMILAALGQDNVEWIQAELEITSGGDYTFGEQLDNFFSENIEPSLETGLARDTCRQQMEFHMGKAFEKIRHDLELEAGSSKNLTKAHDDILDIVREHKRA